MVEKSLLPYFPLYIPFMLPTDISYICRLSLLLGLGLPRARNFLIFNLFKRVFRSLFNAFCSNSSYICLNYRYKFLIYTFSISCLEILGGDSLPPKSLWGETVSLFSPPLHASESTLVHICICK